MSNNNLETMTNIEAKVLYLRYGIKDLDDQHSLRVLRICKGGKVKPEKTASEVAHKLGQDTDLIEQTESSALQKLRALNNSI